MQLTFAPHGHILTNAAVWSPDSRWIVFDTRSDPEGSLFDGMRIARVHVETQAIEDLYHSRNGACCGVATVDPLTGRVIFILGPEHPTADWQYGPAHRQGVLVHPATPDQASNLDARDMVPPFTPGALRGGSHVHVFSPDGQWVSFTYEDSFLATRKSESERGEINLRNVGVSMPHTPICVPKTHPRNHDGTYFSVIVTRTKAHPQPGSDEICKAYEDAWINGYQKPDGTRQKRALAFLGDVISPSGKVHPELFLADLPDDLTQPGDGPLAGTEQHRPFPPLGIVQRRLTFTSDRIFPGIQGPRHWPRSSPDGTQIAFLMKDDHGIVQFWTQSPNGGAPTQITSNQHPIASAFSWSPDGRNLAHVMDQSLCITDLKTGITERLTERYPIDTAPRPEACVFSPDGRRIAYVRSIAGDLGVFNQIFTESL